MGWSWFIVYLAKYLAWPLFATVTLLLFRRQLLGLGGLVQSLKYKDVEVNFRENMRVVETASAIQQGTSEPPRPHGDYMSRMLDRFADLTVISPRSAIIEAWVQVELAAIDFLKRENALPASGASTLPPLKLVNALKNGQFLDPTRLKLLNALRNARNDALHVADDAIKESDATDFVLVAMDLVESLRGDGVAASLR